MSYYVARDVLEGPCVISFGDIIFKDYVLRDLIGTSGDIVIAVDTSWWQENKNGREVDCVIGDVAPSDDYMFDRCTAVKEIATGISQEDAHGEWIGLMKLSSHGAKMLKSELESFHNENREKFIKTGINEFLMRLIQKGVAVRAFYCRGHWLDIDSVEDLSIIEKM